MIRYSLIITTILSISALFCSGQVNRKKTSIVHFNVVFAPDLSNRMNSKLYPKPVKDSKIVAGVLDKLFPDILRIRRSVQQMDKFSVDFVNKGLIGIYKVDPSLLSIDFGRFGLKQSLRIDYIQNKSPRKLKNDVQAFNSEYQRINDLATNRNHGADIWTYFNSGISSSMVLPSFNRGGVLNVYRNILILFTDGYIEAGIYGEGFDLSKEKVDAFRKAFVKSKSIGLEKFLQQHPKFKIKPANNSNLKNLEVLVLEMYDRSLSPSGSATMHPTDMEIIRVIWTDWLKTSGVSRFELRPTASSPQEINEFIINYLRE